MTQWSKVMAAKERLLTTLSVSPRGAGCNERGGRCNGLHHLASDPRRKPATIDLDIRFRHDGAGSDISYDRHSVGKTDGQGLERDASAGRDKLAVNRVAPFA